MIRTVKIIIGSNCPKRTGSSKYSMRQHICLSTGGLGSARTSLIGLSADNYFSISRGGGELQRRVWRRSVNDLAALGDVEHAEMARAAEYGVYYIDIESVPRDIDVAEISRGAFGMRTDQARRIPSPVGELDHDTGQLFAVELEGEFSGVPGFGNGRLIDHGQCGFIRRGRTGQGRQRDQTQYQLSALQPDFSRRQT
jgi:hypothetical protein